MAPFVSPKCWAAGQQLLPEHAQATAANEQDSSQDDENAAASARGPSAVRSARTVVAVKVLRPHSGGKSWDEHKTAPSKNQNERPGIFASEQMRCRWVERKAWSLIQPYYYGEKNYGEKNSKFL